MAFKLGDPRLPPPKLDGVGRWSKDAIRQRYREYCRAFRVHPRSLHIPYPRPYDEQWVSPLMDVVCEGIRAGDLACAEIGIEMIEEDGGFAFGRAMKSRTARALGHCPLTDAQKQRICNRVVAMLRRGFLPPEFKDYAWLVRRLKLDVDREHLEERLESRNPWVWWYLDYLTMPNPPPRPGPRF
jgi:hypothetical protein